MSRVRWHPITTSASALIIGTLVTLTLTDGAAEIFGAELPKGTKTELPGGKYAIFSWSGATVELVGRALHKYSSVVYSWSAFEAHKVDVASACGYTGTLRANSQVELRKVPAGGRDGARVQRARDTHANLPQRRRCAGGAPQGSRVWHSGRECIRAHALPPPPTSLALHSFPFLLNFSAFEG